jgi:hypothetical protein
MDGRNWLTPDYTLLRMCELRTQDKGQKAEWFAVVNFLLQTVSTGWYQTDEESVFCKLFPDSANKPRSMSDLAGCPQLTTQALQAWPFSPTFRAQTIVQVFRDSPVRLGFSMTYESAGSTKTRGSEVNNKFCGLACGLKLLITTF